MEVSRRGLVQVQSQVPGACGGSARWTILGGSSGRKLKCAGPYLMPNRVKLPHEIVGDMLGQRNVCETPQITHYQTAGPAFGPA